MLLQGIIEAMGSVHVGELLLTGCDLSSAREGSVLDLISSFSALRDLTLNKCILLPAHFTNELLLDSARRAELTRLHFDVQLPSDDSENAGDVHTAPLDTGTLALLFREAGEGVDVTFRWAVVSDAFSKRLLEVSHLQFEPTLCNELSNRGPRRSKDQGRPKIRLVPSLVLL